MTKQKPDAPPDEIAEADLEKVVGGVSKVPAKGPIDKLTTLVQRWLSVKGTKDSTVDENSEPGAS